VVETLASKGIDLGELAERAVFGGLEQFKTAIAALRSTSMRPDHALNFKFCRACLL